MATVIRTVEAADLPAVFRLNEAALPHVNSLPVAEFDRLRDEAAYFKVAEDGGVILGVTICFLPGALYGSMNYRWFSARFASFLYVDRIIVDPAAQGRGVGRRFYADVEDFARSRARHLTCEVNTRPPNERSLRFHHAWGFREVGTQDTEGGAKAVSLLAKPLHPCAQGV